MLFTFIKRIVRRHHLSIHSRNGNPYELSECAKEEEKEENDDNINLDEESHTNKSGEKGEREETIIAIDIVNGQKCTHRQNILDEKIQDYVQSFTIHGLTKSVTGKRAESTFWTTILAVGIICASVVIYGLIHKYFSRAVYTELISKITDKNYFPSITFCEKNLLQDAYFSYCNTPLSVNKSVPTCDHSKPYVDTSYDNKTWGNSLFSIEKCTTMGNIECNSGKYFKSKKSLNNSCITWNYNGDIHGPYSHVDLVFEFHKPANSKRKVELFALPHDHKIEEIDITKKVEIDSDHKYEIKIDKTIVKRLPAPFPSNCTADKVNDIFPGHYTRFSCMESFYYIDMYKECGDVFDYHREFIPPHIVKEHWRNSTDMRKCLYDYSKMKELKNLKHCNFACKVLDLNYYASFQTRHGNRTSNVYRYEIGLQLKTANEYRVMEEKQLYTLSQMACEIGGFVGLIMGMSVISIIEIFVIIALSIFKKIN